MTMCTFLFVLLIQHASALLSIPRSHKATLKVPRKMALGSLKLYGNQGTRSPLINWYLEEIGAPYEQIDSSSVDRRAPSYPHPFGSVPAALDDGGVQLFESGAILLFIADKYGGLDTPEKRAAVTKWVMWANASLDPICFGGESFVTKLTGSPKAVGVLDGILGKSKWLLGDEFSVADVAVASYLLYALQFFPQVKFASKYPNISKYCNTCAKRPAYIKAFGASVANKLADRAIA